MSYSILLVDDNEVNLKLAQQILVASGYEVRAAARGEQAIEMACTRRPDLILLDIRSSPTLTVSRSSGDCEASRRPKISPLWP